MPNPADATIASLEVQAAEILCLLQTRTTKKPLVIEFSGSPKSGKTTAIGALSRFFRRNDYRVEALPERASISPISNRKGHPDFNVWVSCASLQGLIESTGKDTDLILFDRGIFDGLVWNSMLARIGKLSPQEAETVENFFTMDRWVRLVDLVCVMKCAPAKSIEREYANQLTSKRGAIMEAGILSQLNLAIDDTVIRYGPKFKNPILVDTTSKNLRKATIEITQRTLGSIREYLDESLWVLPRRKMPMELPLCGFSFNEGTARAFVDAVIELGEFVPRSKAELDDSYLIPIPCALVMFRDRVLILRRKEKGHDLHDTYAIWAGGHVMKSDWDGRNTILNCLRRELREELSIQNEFELQPIGIVRTDQGERASRHVGVVYKAMLSDDRVALSLNQREFREKRGTSVSGTLIDIAALQRFFPRMGDWSKFIIEEMWPDQSIG